MPAARLQWILVAALVQTACGAQGTGGVPTLPPGAALVTAQPAAETEIPTEASIPPAASPTPTTPPPTPAADSTEQASCTNHSTFVDDVTIPDGTEIPMGGAFTKIWLVQNSGTCAWDGGYRLVLIERSGGLLPGEESIPMPPVAPGDSVEIGLNMSLGPALIEGGSEHAAYQIEGPDGDPFGTLIFVIVQVGPPESGSTGNATGTISGALWRDFCSPGGIVQGVERQQQGICVGDAIQGFTADGIRQRTESGIGVVLVELHQAGCSGQVVAQGPTASDGTYLFTKLAAGEYCVLINPQRGGNAAILIPGRWTFPEDLSGTQMVEILPGEIRTGVDFGWDPEGD